MKRKNKSTFKILKDKKVQNKERNKIRRIAKQLSKGSTVRYVLLLFEFGVIDTEEFAELFRKELKKMNVKKRGGQYAYSESFLRCAAMIRAKRGLSYRELEDELKRFFPDFDIPAYTTLFTRINDKEVDILNDIAVADHFKEVILSLDASGFTQHAGGRWIEFRIFSIYVGWIFFYRHIIARLYGIIETKYSNFVLKCQLKKHLLFNSVRIY